MRAYWTFLQSHPHLSLFGLLLTGFSGFGQTFFIASFGGAFRDSFHLSHGEFGLVFSLATVASAASLMVVGKGIDNQPLARYTLWVGLSMVAACLLIGWAEQAWLLGLGLYLLRLSGLGLFPHIASTTMARRFTQNRGTAVSTIALGHPIAEPFLPLAGLLLSSQFGWRSCWFVLAAFILLGLLPLLQHLLKRSGSSPSQVKAALNPGALTPALEAVDQGLAYRVGVSKQWTQSEVLKDPRFYLLLPVLLTPAVLNTGVFFHQVPLIEARGWDATWFSGAFLWFSVATILTSLGTGLLVDKLSSLRLLPFFPIPLALGLLVLSVEPHPLAVLAFMVGGGLGIGAAQTLGVSTWAEVYGTEHLGALRSLSTAIMVCSTAITPVAMGFLLDAHWPIEQIYSLLLAYAAVAIGLAFLGLQRVPKQAVAA